MDLSLEQRLLRFLDKEEEGEARTERDLRALSVEERVLEGECIQGAVLLRAGKDGFTFRLEENLSKFRVGDALAVGDGSDFGDAVPLAYAGYDADGQTLRLERDPFARVADPEFEVGSEYVVDRRALGLRGRLQEVVRTACADPLLIELLEGRWTPAEDPERRRRAAAGLAATGLNEPQVEAGAAAIATEGLALVQGPPGTGKTRLLAEVAGLLGGAGCRLGLTAFTHRAVDNALLAIRARHPDLPLVKVGRGGDLAALQQAGIRAVDPRRGRLPETGVVAGTCFQLAKLPPREGFHYTLFDEGGQLPIPHAMVGMLRSRWWLFFGDHKQLPPVITQDHADRDIARSVFEHLHGHYGALLLNRSYRMNESVCGVVSSTFYGGALESAPEVAARKLPFVAGGRLDEVLDPAHGVVLARVDHRHPGMRSEEEARLVADLVEDLVRQHRVAPADIAVIAPFRAQVRLLRTLIEKRALPGAESLVVDTVERIQGQEREAVIVSLAAGDPDSLRDRSKFFFSANRLNVALSRARTKAVLVASDGAFRALPMDPESLAVASLFKDLRAALPEVDLTAVYGRRLG